MMTTGRTSQRNGEEARRGRECSHNSSKSSSGGQKEVGEEGWVNCPKTTGSPGGMGDLGWGVRACLYKNAATTDRTFLKYEDESDSTN